MTKSKLEVQAHEAFLKLSPVFYTLSHLACWPTHGSHMNSPRCAAVHTNKHCFIAQAR